MDSVLNIQGTDLTITPHLLDSMNAAGMSGLVGKIKAALLLAKRHSVGWRIELGDDEVVKQVLPRSDSKKDLTESEALVMAVELHHIFKHNPNVYKWPVKLAKHATAYLIRRKGATEALMTTLILNERGYYWTSFDPTTGKFFPEVSGLSPKAMHKIYPQFLDELQNMYTEVRKNIEELREKEGE